MACTAPTEVKNGYVAYESLAGGATWPDTTDVMYKCFRFYGLAKSDRLTCTTGTWTGTTPVCDFDITTEILFWFLIVVVVLLLLLLVLLMIFVCCYFGRCCGSGKEKWGRLDDYD